MVGLWRRSAVSLPGFAQDGLKPDPSDPTFRVNIPFPPHRRPAILDDVTAMASPFSDLLQTDPGLGLLRLAALMADEEAEPDDETLDAMEAQVRAGVLAGLASSDMWPELVKGLMARAPSNMIYALRESGALDEILPESARLFGVPQISDDPAEVDLGDHLMNALDEAAKRHAPLAVRFALLVMNVGKADSPPEHLPVHYRHVERGRPRIEAICARFGAPSECRALAVLALAECERVHRVSEVRAGPVAAMLERLGAFDDPRRFELLMMVCASDYGAYAGRSGQDYPKARLLTAALAACAAVLPDSGISTPDALMMARATAIANAFRSVRWSD